MWPEQLCWERSRIRALGEYGQICSAANEVELGPFMQRVSIKAGKIRNRSWLILKVRHLETTYLGPHFVITILMGTTEPRY